MKRVSLKQKKKKGKKRQKGIGWLQDKLVRKLS